MFGAFIVRAVLGQERIKDWPHLFASALTGGWEKIPE